MWHGKMIDPDAQNGGTTDLDAALQQTDRGLSGNITWKNPSGGWRSLGNATFVISSGVVAGDKVSIIASDDLAGGKVTMNFTGTIRDTTITGTNTVSVTSIMGGATVPGTFEIKKE